MSNIVQNLLLISLKILNLNTLIENVTSIVDLWETVWGNMSVMTMGSFHVFTKIVTLTCVLQVKLHFFEKTHFADSLYK